MLMKRILRYVDRRCLCRLRRRLRLRSHLRFCERTWSLFQIYLFDIMAYVVSVGLCHNAYNISFNFRSPSQWPDAKFMKLSPAAVLGLSSSICMFSTFYPLWLERNSGHSDRIVSPAAAQLCQRWETHLGGDEHQRAQQ